MLGQYVFTTRNKNAGAGDSSVVSNGFLYPEGLVVMDGRLMLADVRNNRILIFALYPVVETTALSNMTGVSAQSGGNVTDDVGENNHCQRRLLEYLRISHHSGFLHQRRGPEAALSAALSPD